MRIFTWVFRLDDVHKCNLRFHIFLLCLAMDTLSYMMSNDYNLVENNGRGPDNRSRWDVCIVLEECGGH